MTLTHRQEEILLYFYRFRYLNRFQIQKLLNHKHFNRIIRKYYNPKTVTIAAVYSLGSKGRKYLIEKSKEKESTIQPQLLNRVWREYALSDQFRTHCLFIADIYLLLMDLIKKTNATLHFFTRTDLHGHDYILNPRPDAYIAIKEQNGKMKRYFLDIFDPLPPRMILRRRIKQYVDYFDDDTWPEATKHPFPQIIIICPDDRSKRYLYRYIQKTLEYAEDIKFYLTTWAGVRNNGIDHNSLEIVKETD